MVVDDDRDARELLTATLGYYGADVTAAESAAEALALLPEVRPDVLLSDIGMSGEDGYSFIRRVRALPADRGGLVPAVAITAYADRGRSRAGDERRVPAARPEALRPDRARAHGAAADRQPVQRQVGARRLSACPPGSSDRRRRLQSNCTPRPPELKFRLHTILDRATARRDSPRHYDRQVSSFDGFVARASAA